ncbi:30S ribosomal protein S11 [Candidatus Woesearchaeota archaeon]|nr:30S ribosomal protein S11 [Nanoarchaeota archaeon]MCB9370043.1 30S ribosomal protein S11 [Candidatus Woesearchaeota archaeon]USN44946.1 MAG: 30S ribosomal protein S11 [Candidatus Woesearchaeota archaeon]
MPEATEKASKKEVSSKKTSKKSELSEKKVSKTSGNEDEQVLDVEVPEEKPKKTKQEKEVWGILHLYSSYNNTHLHVTDVTGSETIVKATGGMVTKSDRLKATPNVAMAAAKLVAEGCKNAGVTSLYVKLRAVGGHNGPMTPGPGSQATIRMLTRYGIKLGRIEDVTPVPHDSCRKKGGKRGRRV